MRVRAFTQDDAHIFCTEDQIQSEVSSFIDLLHKVYADFGFREVLYKLSTRPVNRIGSDDLWDKAEHALEQALNSKGLPWDLQPGEGAFYGPKIEFSLRDSIGRVWQCGTIPVMLHRAVFGSMERFIGILIEEFAGSFPAWLAPVQAVILTITDGQADYARAVAETLRKQGLRVETDLRNEKIGFKIREHTLQRIPYLLVVGKKEAQQGTVAVRTRKGEDLGSLTLPAFGDRLAQEIAGHGLIVLEG